MCVQEGEMRQRELKKLKEMLARLTYGQRQELMKEWASKGDMANCVEILDPSSTDKATTH
jgi:hypothetical protein